MTEANVATKYGCSAEMHFARLQYDRLVQWQTIELVILPGEDAKQDGIARNLHGHVHFNALIHLRAGRPCGDEA